MLVESTEADPPRDIDGEVATDRFAARTSSGDSSGRGWRVFGLP
jgi:hypothetical protein